MVLPARQPVRSRLVFVHGVGGPRTAGDYLAEWTEAFIRGAVAAGHSETAAGLAAGADVDIVFACYSDLFQLDSQGGTDGLSESTAPLVGGMLYELAENLIGSEQEERSRLLLADILAQLRPNGTPQGAGNIARVVLDAATAFMESAPLRRIGQWSSARLLVRDLSQVARYLNRSELQGALTLDQRIRARVRECLGNGPAIVVSHSLGTVVAFETLHEFAGQVPLFVTLGSPLGMRSVVWPRLRPRPPRTPEPARRWLNFWDRDDVIVSRPRLEASMAPSVHAVLPVSARIDSDGIWVHTATKYLAQPAVAGPVMEALASGCRTA